jgi:PAS domain S-box-containing protein
MSARRADQIRKEQWNAPTCVILGIRFKHMGIRDQSLKRKTTAVIMLTSTAVLLLTSVAFTVYDLVTYRRNRVQSLSATAAIIADHSSGALALRDAKDGRGTLASLRADPRVVASALYDAQGHLFVRYPATAPSALFPPAPGNDGWRSEGGQVILVQPVLDGRVRVGTLYLKSEVLHLYPRLRFYGGTALAVLLGSVSVALVISTVLQQRVTRPILALAQVAREVSKRGDYSLRARKFSEDETGLLTDAFNGMLARIEAQTEALRRNEEVRSYLAAIVESSDDAIVGKDLNAKVVSWNDGAERMFGYSAAEMLGQPITRLQSPDRPEEEEQILEQAKRGATRHYETVRIRKDGTPVELSLTVSPIRNARDEIIGISSIAHDIADRKRAEREIQESRARLSGIIGSAMDAIISIDSQQRVTIFNEAAERMFDCPASEAVGEPLDRFIPARFREAHRQHVEQFGRTGTTSRAMGSLQPLAGLRADGEEFPIEASISHIEVGGQQIYTVILRDITERKRTEDQIRQLNAELEQRVADRTAELTAANKELESFTYSVAHDLRAPLRHIDAFSKILHEDFVAVLPLEAQHYLNNIRASTGKMSMLVDDLLNLARVGRQELRRQTTPLSKLVDAVLDDLKQDTAGRRLVWHIEPLPAVECDPGLMKQVFANLLSNAVKYTRPRPVAVIEVGCRKTNGDIAVFVRDNGVGFNMKYADKLFGVFQRFHRAEEFEGTGVGLATVDRIVRKHGGHIWAEAAVDQGATFYFTVAGLEEAAQVEQQQMAI